MISLDVQSARAEYDVSDLGVWDIVEYGHNAGPAGAGTCRQTMCSWILEGNMGVMQESCA